MGIGIGTTGLEFDSWTGQIGHGVVNGSPALRCFFAGLLPRRSAAEMDPATRYMLRRDTTSMMKI